MVGGLHQHQFHQALNRRFVTTFDHRFIQCIYAQNELPMFSVQLGIVNSQNFAPCNCPFISLQSTLLSGNATDPVFNWNRALFPGQTVDGDHNLAKLGAFSLPPR
jgi:hypothetical protein